MSAQNLLQVSVTLPFALSIGVVTFLSCISFNSSLTAYFAQKYKAIFSSMHSQTLLIHCVNNTSDRPFLLLHDLLHLSMLSRILLLANIVGTALLYKDRGGGGKFSKIFPKRDVQNFPFLRLSFCLCCVCVFCLFIPFLSAFYVFHRKDLVLLNLTSIYMTSTNE